MRLLLLFILSIPTLLKAQSLLDQQLAHYSCKADLIQCLTELEKQTGLRFSYKQEKLEGLRSSISLTDSTTVKEVLHTLLLPHYLNYNLYDGNKVSIFSRPSKTIVGLVLDHTNGEVIPQARVHIVGTEIDAYTNEYGMFRLQTPADSFEIYIIKEGFQMLSGNVTIKEYQYYIFKMGPMRQFKPVDISATDSTEVYMSSKAFIEIDPSLKKIPSFAGETDALSNMRLKGGIQNIGLGDPGLIVRGGGPDQNFILIDGIPVYNTFHILGLYSIFNSSTINSIKLYKDAFPSKYGSRLSSVVDVNLFNGNKKELSGDADIGIVSSGFSLNGPIVKDKLSFSLAARRTYADILTYPVQKFLNRNDAQDNTTSLWYYDVFAKLHFQANKKSQFKLTFYNGGDALNFSSKLSLFDSLNTRETTSGDLKWRNSLIGAQWHYIFSPSLFITVQSAFSSYKMQFSDAYSYDQIGSAQSNQVSYNTGLSEQRNCIDFDHFAGGSNHILFGAGLVSYNFEPFSQSYESVSDLGSTDTTFNTSKLISREFYAYFEDNIYLKNGLLSAGIRLSRFTTGTREYVSFQPRLFLSRNMSNKVQFRFSISDMSQFLHLLPNNNLGLPIDIWLPVAKDIKPLRSFQISTGLKWGAKYLSGSAYVFAKNYRNLIEHNSGSNFLLNGEDWTNTIEIGRGSSAGIETNLEWNKDEWQLEGAYTFCRSTRIFEGLNNGGTYFSKYDRPHSINFYGEYAFNPKTSISVSFTYASGNPITVPSSRFVTTVGGKQVIVEEYNDINNYRLPATHHLDIAFKQHRKYPKVETDLVFGIYNLYNQLNPFMVYIGLDEKIEPVLKLRSYLPMMPMLKYHISF